MPQRVKNPAGFRQSLRTVDGLKPAATVIAINDDYADGRDMSWLWDVQFEACLSGTSGTLVTAGTRAADMALRLQYDGLHTELVEADLNKSVTWAVEQIERRQTVVVFATYTAMWELHRLLDRAATPAAVGPSR